MSLDKFAELFKIDVLARIEAGLRRECNVEGNFIHLAYLTLEDAIKDGKIGILQSSIPVPIPERGMCELLAVAGYLRRVGNDILKIYYVPTEDGRRLFVDSTT